MAFKGKLRKDAVNPIVKIELENNRQGYLDRNLPSFKNVLTKLQSEYNFDKFDFCRSLNGELNICTIYDDIW